jgi:AcrR family transcriptional regulator
MPQKPDTTSDRVRIASAKRREEHKADTREAIFRAAAELLDEAGYPAFSLRKLAARIGYTPTTIYRYFRDKDELVIAVMLEGYAAFTRALAAATARSDDPFEQLDALGEAYVEFGLAHPVMYRVLFMTRPDIWLRIPPERVAAVCGEDSFSLLVGAVQRAIATGRTRTKDVEGTSLALWALTHGIVSLCLAMPNMVDPAERKKMIAGAFAMADLQLLA